jgi:hypothetical protein
MSQTLKQKIIPRLHLDGFESEEKEEILSMLENILKEKIFIAILDQLTHEEKAELQKMSEGEYVEKLGTFLEPKITQFKKIIDTCSDEVIGEFNALRA